MKILIFGKNGQVGCALKNTLSSFGEVRALGRDQANFESDETLRSCLHDYAPQVVINAVAYTAVDLAESESRKAYQINATAVGEIAKYCQKSGALFVHYSTDYVFDGQKEEPYQENDRTNPINVYGQSKLAGEEAVIQSGCQYLIFRTSWVYADIGKNFIKTIWRLAQERDTLQVVSDQIGAPTSALFIADITARALIAFYQGTLLSGLYHLTPNGFVSWYQLAMHIVEKANQYGIITKVTPQKITPILTADYPTPAQRPLNSLLNHQRLEQILQIPFPDWQDAVDAFVAHLARSGLSNV